MTPSELLPHLIAANNGWTVEPDFLIQALSSNGLTVLVSNGPFSRKHVRHSETTDYTLQSVGVPTIRETLVQGEPEKAAAGMLCAFINAVLGKKYIEDATTVELRVPPEVGLRLGAVLRFYVRLSVYNDDRDCLQHILGELAE